MQKELRFFAQELRAAGTDTAPKIEGMAATFGTVTDIGQFREVIQKGAFTRSLADPTQEKVCLYNHNPDVVLGRVSAGTLSLEQTDRGLKFSCSVPDTTAARDVYTNLKLGNIRECSFGFGIDDPGTMLRTLKSVRLFDVSVVTFPAYGGTSASARHVVADYAESRMAGATLAANTLQRKARAQVAIDAHESWQRSQISVEMAAEDERLKVRLEFLKSL
jgi:uncharacterized protein